MQGTFVAGTTRKAAMAAVGLLLTLAFGVSSSQAAAPTILRTGVTKVSATTAVLEASVNPQEAPTGYRFEYGLSNCSSGPCTSVPLPEGQIPAEVSGSGDLVGKGPGVSEAQARTITNVVTNEGAFGVGEVITGTGIPAQTTITAVDSTAKTLTLSQEATASGTGVSLRATGPQPVSVLVEGLSPSTIYHYRVVAKNPAETAGPDRIFATYGQTFEGLPDSRAYEQATPVDKDGGDAQGAQSTVKATPQGNGITFGSTFGIPGGKGAHDLPSYLASRSSSSWLSEGLLPPVSVGEKVRVIGWSPDYSRTYSSAARLGNPITEGLVEQSGPGQPIVIGPYVSGAEYSFVGESPDGSTVFFEAKTKLPPKEGGTPIAAATEGVPNLYAWDTTSREVRLVGTFNEGEGAPKGSFAGPYDWSIGTNAFDLHEGGGQRSYYLSDMRAITPAGDVYFTAAGTGQLYLRLNPSKSQSPMQGGKCKDPELACTIHVSASKKTNGNGTGGADSVGEQPAAFQAASKDGSKVFFTSSEKLTNNANTGPEQPKAEIARDTINGAPANIEKEFIPKRAVGVTRFGPWLYWADPKLGVIGRVKLDSEEKVEVGTEDEEFIVVPPSEGKCEEEVKPGDPNSFEPITEPIPAEPRYLAVDAEHIYWTNTGRRDDFGIPIDGGGTIGRAKLNGESVEEIEPAFICGEEAAQPGKRLVSNPQGIAVDSGHIYWADAAQASSRDLIARAKIDGSEAEEEFVKPVLEVTPYGVAVNGSHLYFDLSDVGTNDSFLERVNLEGEKPLFTFIGEAGLRGIALDSGHLYWATQGEGRAIGRSDLELENVENKFIDIEGAPNGLTEGASHLFWAANGETASNAGNDLYRYEPATDALTDLTPLPPAPGSNGAEVQGVLGASADGSYLYFAANGVLAAGGAQGNCKGSVRSAAGKCNLYLWHEGQVSFIAPLRVDGEADALNWVGTPAKVFNSGSYKPRTAYLGEGGATLVFRSREKLTAYDNEGVSEFYRYRASEPGKVTCLTCPPSGEAAGRGPGLTSIAFPVTGQSIAIEAVMSRNLSTDGNRFFFETTEALSPADTNGEGGCPLGSPQRAPACLDVYEWEAPSTGSCTPASPSYSLLDEGCVYLISTGKSSSPSLFADASEDGKNAFFFTRQSLVGQDQDELLDVYDARVDGGLPAQNPPPANPCQSAEACRGPAQAPPAQGSPATSTFVGPGNVAEKHKKQKAKKKKKKHTHKGQKKHRSAKAKVGRGQ